MKKIIIIYLLSTANIILGMQRQPLESDYFATYTQEMQRQPLESDFFATFTQEMPQSLLKIAPENRTTLEYFCDKVTQEANTTPPKIPDLLNYLQHTQQALIRFRMDLSAAAQNPNHNEETNRKLQLFKAQLVTLKKWAERIDSNIIESKKFDQSITLYLSNQEGSGISQQIYVMVQCANFRHFFPKETQKTQPATSGPSSAYAFGGQ